MSKDSKNSGVERRRFTRVGTKNSGVVGLGAQITWPNHEISEVLDLSYKGVAVVKPGLFQTVLRDSVTVEVQLGVLPKFSANARVAWTSPNGIGLEMPSLPAEGHQAMALYLDAKLIGAGLRPVDKSLFSPGQSFSHWYQGPDGTHVFIWLNGARLIEKISVDFGGQVLEFRRGYGRPFPTETERRALLIISQLDKDGLPLEEFMKTLTAGENVG